MFSNIYDKIILLVFSINLDFSIYEKRKKNTVKRQLSLIRKLSIIRKEIER